MPLRSTGGTVLSFKLPLWSRENTISKAIHFVLVNMVSTLSFVRLTTNSGELVSAEAHIKMFSKKVVG